MLCEQVRSVSVVKNGKRVEGPWTHAGGIFREDLGFHHVS